MTNLSFAETSEASRNAILAAKVAKTLHHLKARKPLDESRRKILHRGATLLSEIVEGSRLIEQPETAEKASRFDLQAYSHALSALANLKITISEADLTKTFSQLREDLIAIADEGGNHEQKLDELGRFFSLLRNYFSHDFQKVPPTTQTEPAFLALRT